MAAPTCVFVFMPQEGAALLEDLGAQVAGVHAVLQPPLLGRRGRVRVVLLLHRRGALRAAVRPPVLLLGGGG